MSLKGIIKNPNLISSFDLWGNDSRKLDTHLDKIVNKYKLKKKHTMKPVKPIEFLKLKKECDSIINEYKFSTEDREYYKRFLSGLIIKFIMTFGLKYKTIQKIKVDDIYEENKFINLNGVRLPIPNNLRYQIQNYLEIRKKLNIVKLDFFIYTFSNYDIYRNSYVDKFLYDYKCKYKYGSKVINITGISKFSIIEMLKKGLPEDIIIRFTGMGETIIGDCIDRLEGEGSSYVENIDFINRYMQGNYNKLEIFNVL